jgi:Mg/Co/Ni transporter MgtE
LSLKRDLLDKQIVDVAGTRVVRVNDLRIGTFENKMCVLGIDPSFRGLLRRLGLAGTFLARPFDVKLIDFREASLLEGNAALQLSTAEEKLSRLHPADLANLVENLDVKQGSSLLSSLDSAEAAKVLEEVDPGLQTTLVQYLGPEAAGKIMSHMSSDELVDLVKTFSASEAAKYLSQISGRTEQLMRLISYPDNTAGGLMTPDYIAVRPGWSVERAFEEIRKKTPGMRSILYVYAVDEHGRLHGVISLRRLIAAPPGIQLHELIKNLRYYDTLKVTDEVSTIVKLMTKYNLYVAAVVDSQGKMLGVVTIDDVMRLLAPTA